MEQLGELLLMDAFEVSEPRQRIPKTAHQRHVFLFELGILFTKKTICNAAGGGSSKEKFTYKNRLMVSA